MSVVERRTEIMRLLVLERSMTMQQLANKVGSTEHTVRNDIAALMLDYPIETKTGNGGGVRIADDYHPYKVILPKDFIETVVKLMPYATDEGKRIITRTLRVYGNVRDVPLIEEDKPGDDPAVK